MSGMAGGTRAYDVRPGDDLHGRRLAAARIGCFGVGLLSAAVWGWGVPLRYAQLSTVCSGGQCGDQQPTPSSVPLFHAAGISLRFYAIYTGTVEVLFAVVFLALAAAIFVLRSRSGIGLVTAAFLASFGATQTSATALAAAIPAWSLTVNLLQPLSFVFLVLFLYLFPDGHFVPRRTRYVALAWIPLFMVGSLVVPPDVFVVPLFGFIAVSLGAQVFRYRRISTPAQRQQTKWVVFGVSVGVLGSITLIAMGNLPILPNVFGSRLFLIGNTLIYVVGATIPVAITIAILRSRLFDIDVVIRRTVMYGSLTALLAIVYAALILGLEGLLDQAGRADSQRPLVLVISTLAIAALFQPLRRRLQRAIDRRFYRRKYDAARTLERFAATLRQDVDLAELRAHLVGVVEETMRPAHVSLWLRREVAP
jgi:hypothetical protein